MSVKDFVKKWSERGYEKGESQPFWLSLLCDVFNIAEPENFIRFEVPIPHGFIDGLIDSTKVLIEQKSSTVNLDAEEIFRQAKRYNDALEYSRKARWIITCNFKEFRVFNMDKRYPERETLKISLFELPKKFSALNFLVELQDKISYERELSIQASAIVAKIYDELRAELKIQTDDALSDLNKLCVRLVFCLYAESIDIFGKHKIFRDYLRGARNIRQDLLELFKVLDTPLENRSPYLDDTLKKYTYVDGGLFADEIDFPNFTNEIKKLLLDKASSNFRWEDISPAIFGTVFESTINPKVRRANGMHYTSTENIHKVIDPLFMDELRFEFEIAKKSVRNRRKNLLALQDKIAALKFLDPACGSGNFLTETFICLRRLENEILKELLGSQIQLGELNDPIKVSIQNFYGIEINNFAVTVAQTALWIAELKMKRETEEIVHKGLELFPLKSYPNIIQANALHVDWKNFSPDVDYIISNPPFVGHQWRTAEQIEDMKISFPDYDKHGKLDYVAAWYSKAAEIIRDTKISCAFVSTNSIVQGESVRVMWEYLFGKGIVINFAYRTFKWSSESFDFAAVHCVIIGFSNFHAPEKFIFDCDKKIHAKNINAYLLDAPNIFIENRGNPPKGFPKMTKGSQPTDGGNLLLKPAERDELIKKNPLAEKYIFQFIGGDEFINGKLRYCLWLVDCPPNELRKMPLVMKRLEKVREFRLQSKTASVRRAAETPALFTQIRQPTTNFLAVPEVSSERRKYIPIGFMTPDVIVSNLLYTIPNATIYLFGMLTSSIHMAWLRTIGGRLESRYRYSPAVYYNFPFSESTTEQKKLIEQSAQNILDVRSKYPQSTLADLYDELTMPADLRLAHKKNDRAVAAAYGFENFLDDESKIVAELLKLYERLTNEPLPPR